MRISTSSLPAIIFCLMVSTATWAQTQSQEEVVEYTASFFERYQPNTALDMVEQLPGFQLNDGGELRGFSDAAGNILINNRRPSAKQDLPSQILTRIPATHVERIELIRGQVRDIYMQGQSVLANVILRDDAPAAYRWELFGQENLEFGLAPGANISLSDRWQDIDYNAGISFFKSIYGRTGPERLFDPDDTLLESRDERRENDNSTLSTNLNASSWLGETLVQLNLNPYYENRTEDLRIDIDPRVPGRAAGEEVFDVDQDLYRLEAGLDLERQLFGDLSGKGILLFTHEVIRRDEAQRDFDDSGDRILFRLADTATDSTEAIARLELDWAGWNSHLVRANLEGAFNVLDSTLDQTEDSGGGLVVIDVPGGNARVEEVRWDLLLQDTWSLNDDLQLTYGLGAEFSTISQTGDAEQERSFSFIKPQAVLVWSPSRDHQTQLRLDREIAQLDFNDFVTATVFRDDDLILGNPDLKPDSTWIAELSHEWRFSDLGVVRLTAFHHWVEDTLDLLPLTPTFEATGNIGDGTRYGLRAETTLPLEWTGLTGARLDIKARIQESSVTDPVTGEDRQFSADESGDSTFLFDNESDYAWEVTYRQDFQQARVAWGWFLRERAERPFFKADELDVYDEAYELTAFVETTRWWDLKIRLEFMNLFNLDMDRQRSVFAGERALTPLAFREERIRNRGRRIQLNIRGTF